MSRHDNSTNRADLLALHVILGTNHCQVIGMMQEGLVGKSVPLYTVQAHRLIRKRGGSSTKLILLLSNLIKQQGYNK